MRVLLHAEITPLQAGAPAESRSQIGASLNSVMLRSMVSGNMTLQNPYVLDLLHSVMSGYQRLGTITFVSAADAETLPIVSGATTRCAGRTSRRNW